MALHPRAKNERGVDIRELFTVDPLLETRYMRAATNSPLGRVFLLIDTILKHVEPHSPRKFRSRAMVKAIRFTLERLNGEEGLGAIFPAMANALMAFDAVGYAKDHPDRMLARRAIDKLLVSARRRSVLPAVRFAHLGHVAHRARASRDGRSRVPR